MSAGRSAEETAKSWSTCLLITTSSRFITFSSKYAQGNNNSNVRLCHHKSDTGLNKNFKTRHIPSGQQGTGELLITLDAFALIVEGSQFCELSLNATHELCTDGENAAAEASGQASRW